MLIVAGDCWNRILDKYPIDWGSSGLKTRIWSIFSASGSWLACNPIVLDYIITYEEVQQYTASWSSGIHCDVYDCIKILSTGSKWTSYNLQKSATIMNSELHTGFWWKISLKSYELGELAVLKDHLKSYNKSWRGIFSGLTPLRLLN